MLFRSRIQLEALMATIYKINSVEVAPLDPSYELPDSLGRGIDFEVSVNPESMGVQLLLKFEKDSMPYYITIVIDRFGVAFSKADSFIDWHYGVGSKTLNTEKYVRSDKNGPIFDSCEYHAQKTEDKKWRCTISFMISDLRGAEYKNFYLRLTTPIDNITAPAGNVVRQDNSGYFDFFASDYVEMDLDEYFNKTEEQETHGEMTWREFEIHVENAFDQALDGDKWRIAKQWRRVYLNKEGGARSVRMDIHVAERRQGGFSFVIDAKHFKVSPLSINEIDSTLEYKRMCRASKDIIIASNVTYIPLKIEEYANKNGVILLRADSVLIFKLKGLFNSFLTCHP